MAEYVVEMEVIGRYKTVIFAESIDEAKKLATKFCKNRYRTKFDKVSYKVKSVEDDDCIFNY